MTAESPPLVMTTGSFTLQLVADPARFGAVRRVVRAYLRMWARSALEDAAVLSVTELLTNVHRHVASPTCVLTLSNSVEGVRICVDDNSSAPPVMLRPDWSSESGRGLLLLTGTADQWGVAANADGGKRVWVLLRDAS